MVGPFRELTNIAVNEPRRLTSSLFPPCAMNPINSFTPIRLHYCKLNFAIFAYLSPAFHLLVYCGVMGHALALLVVHMQSLHPAATLQASYDLEEKKRVESKDHVYNKWRGHSARVRAKGKISSTYDGWTSQKDVLLRGVPKLGRVPDVLDVAWGHQMQKATRLRMTSSEAKAGFWCNVSQSVQRKPWGGPGVLTTRSRFYSFEHDFTLDGNDFLRLQGAPMATAPGFSDHELRDLGGEAFPCPCITAFSFAFYMNPWAPWWHE